MQSAIEKLKTQIERLSRIRLGNLPTPLEDLPRLSKLLAGPRILVKHDDYTGFGGGGNKIRKLEFIMADALNKEVDVVITAGGVQSNHARETAAAARKLGMNCVLVLVGEEPECYDGNLLLDRLFCAEVQFVRNFMEVNKVMENIADDLRKRGCMPYIIPLGGICPLGVIGYADCVLELIEQARKMGIRIDYIVTATGSGGTQAGLILGVKALNLDTKVLGISVGTKAKLQPLIANVVNDAAKLLELDLTVTSDEILIYDDYVGPGYGKCNQEIIDTIKLFSKTEAILLDPVYTGKAAWGLVDLIKKGKFEKKENVLFIHTGGIPVLPVYKNEFK
jgi:D-cysteine desulfhydrase family pyridoxal phosphate-dependent enzyme